MVRRFGYASFALFAALSVAGTARAQTPPPADAPPEAPPPAADAPVAAPPAAVPAAPVVDSPPPSPPAPVPAAAAPPPNQLKIGAGNGTSMRLGVLFQPAFQVAGSTARDGYAEDLFIRRTRILIGGEIFGAFDYFFDSDFANIGLAGSTTGEDAMGAATNNTRKAIPGMNIQDAFVTWKSLGDPFKVDVGYMLPANSHNGIQGATTLYGWDYFAYTFLHNAGFSQNGAASTANPALAGVVAGTSSVGRDVGVQARGLVLGGMLEYRVGAFQGIRSVTNASDPASSNPPRIAARLQVNLLDPETGFFYAGSYLGKKKILSIGASMDFQKAPTSTWKFDDAYRTWNVDGFLDMPVGPGVLTAQVDYIAYHGGLLIAGLPKNTIGSEAGYLIQAANISPIVRYERRWGGQSGGADIPAINRYAAGVAFWPFGHNANVKLFYSRIQEENAPHGANQVNAQLQLYYY